MTPYAPPSPALARARARRHLLGTALTLLAVLAIAPRPADARRALVDLGPADPTAALLAALALLVWALALWVALGVAVLGATRLPGLAGRTAGAVARRVVPSAVRRAAEVALGAGLALGAVGVLPAAAETAPGGSAGAVSLDWPTGTGAAPTSAPSTAGPADPQATGAGTAVVVAPGDTLWALAEQGLRAGGDPAPTGSAVAAAWPVWWSANREAIGADPDLLRPGTSLQAPAAPD